MQTLPCSPFRSSSAYRPAVSLSSNFLFRAISILLIVVASSLGIYMTYLFSICSSFTFYETLIFLVAYCNFTHATSEINVSCNYSYSVLLLLRNISMSLFARSLSIQFSTSLYVYNILQCLSLYLVFALFHFCSSLYLIVSNPTQHFVLRLNFYFLPHL